MDIVLYYGAQGRHADVSDLGADVPSVGRDLGPLLSRLRYDIGLADRGYAGGAVHDFRRAGACHARDRDDLLCEYIVHVLLVEILRALYRRNTRLADPAVAHHRSTCRRRRG